MPLVPTQYGRRAFTLIELLVVIVVLLIAAAVVIPNIGTTADSQSISAARTLAAHLELTRNLALTTQMPHSVVFSTDNQSYKVVANYAGQSYSTVVAVAHPAEPGRRLEATLAALNGMSGVQVVAVSFGGNAYVTFDSAGEPSAAGTVTLRAGQIQMQISVAALTGMVSVTRTAG